jgi:NAD(P)H-hydrate epimerase
MRLAEENAAKRGLPLATLAGNAASACFDYISRTMTVADSAAVVLCGKGMNGGDGMLIASMMREAGAEVLCIFADGTPRSGLSGEILSRLNASLTSVVYAELSDTIRRVLDNADIIIDCVFGSGFDSDSREFPPHIAELFRFANGCPCKKISVDLPSGISADSGKRAVNAFVPDVTLCLGSLKKGLLAHPTCDFCGEIVVADIGLLPEDYAATEAKFIDADILGFRPTLRKSAHKGICGRLLNIAGCSRYPGAALLSSKAAINAGVGLVALATPAQVMTAIASAIPEAVFIDTESDFKAFAAELQSYDAVVLGCGMGNVAKTRKTAEFVIKAASCPIILDADGINSISDNINVLQTGKPDRLILTPHPGEFSRISGLSVAEIQSNRVDYARLFAKESGAVIVLKGMNTVVASPNGSVLVNSTGNAGLAKAGTGDVLAGVIGAVAAMGVPPFEAAALGVYLHGLAADRLAEELPLSGITANAVAQKLQILGD